MLLRVKVKVLLVSTLLLMVLPAGLARTASPPLPATYYGTVRLSGADVPAGTTVTASIQGVEYAHATTTVESGRSVYTLDVPGDDPDTAAVEGGTEGDTVHFEVGGYLADQTGTWTSGTPVEVNLTATPPPAPPVAYDQSVTTDEDTPIAITLVASDPDDDPLSYAIIDAPAHGALSGTPPEVVYTPEGDYHGGDSFTFRANDGSADSNVATVTLTISSVPDAPVLHLPGDVTLDEGEERTLPVEATDPDGDSLTLSAGGLPSFARFLDEGDGQGSLTLTPGYEQAGVYSGVIITASDGTHSTSGTLSITVVDVASPPQAAFSVGKAYNLAIQKNGGAIVDYSSIYGSDTHYLADNAIDGNNDTHWRSAQGRVNGEWIKIELSHGQTHVLHRIVLHASSTPRSLRRFEIRVSDTGSDDADFTTVLTGTLPQENRNVSFSLPAVRARYVQLVALDNYGGNSLQLYEIRMWARAREGGIVSLREGPPASIVDFSNARQEPDYQPHLMLNESRNGVWRTENGHNQDEWVIVDLAGQSFTIERVLLAATWWGRPRHFQVRVSTTTTDTAAFTTVFNGTLADEDGLQSFTLPPTPARYVQLYLQDTWRDLDTLRVQQFRVLDGEGANVARSAGVGAYVVDTSSQRTSTTPYGYGSNAIDFDTHDAWITEMGDSVDQWITVRLIPGAPYLINRVAIQSDDSMTAPRDFEIRVSTTGTAPSDFSTIASGRLEQREDSQWIAFPAVPARYVQLYIHDNHGYDYLVVRQIRVYSPELGGDTVPFDDLSRDPSGDIVKWDWDFGDGITSSEPHPVHTYADPGTYPVRLTTTNETGITATATMSYTVLQPPDVDFDWSPKPVEEGADVAFSQRIHHPDGVILDYQWDYLSSTASGPNVEIIFPDNGSYFIGLKVFDSQYLTTRISRTVIVQNGPPRVHSGDDRTEFWGVPFTPNSSSDDSLGDRSSLRCRWEWGDGQSEYVDPCYPEAASRVPHAYDVPGVYTATLTVTDKEGAANSDQTVVTATIRESLVVNYYARARAPGLAEIETRLFDISLFEPLSGKEVSFTLPSGVYTATTDGGGRATLTTPANPGDVLTVTAAFAGNTFYNPHSDSDELTVVSYHPPAGDIVFIIDESASMHDDHQEVKANVSKIVEQLHTVDHRIGLVGYGTLAPNVVGHIHTPLTDNLAQFNRALNELQTGGAFEPGFNAIVVGMSDALGFRDNVPVCAIMITDESATVNINPDAPETQAEAITALESRNAIFLGIINPDAGPSRDDYGPNPGSLADATGGEVFDILDFRENAGPVLVAVIDRCAQAIFERTPPDLRLIKSAGAGRIAAGHLLTYTLTVSNPTVQRATGVVLTDTLPTQTSFVDASHSGVAEGGAVTWPAFTLPSGTVTSRTVTVRVDTTLPDGVSAITNTAVITDDGSRGADPTPSNNLATVSTPLSPNAVTLTQFTARPAVDISPWLLLSGVAVIALCLAWLSYPRSSRRGL